MAHVPSTLPRGSGERENAIFQVAGAIVGSNRPRPGELQEVAPAKLGVGDRSAAVRRARQLRQLAAAGRTR